MKNIIIAIGLLLSVQVKGQTIAELNAKMIASMASRFQTATFNRSIGAVSQDSVVFTFIGLTTAGTVNVSYSGAVLPLTIVHKGIRVSANTVTVYFYNASVTTAQTPVVDVNAIVTKY